jgi:hypothetical protein
MAALLSCSQESEEAPLPNELAGIKLIRHDRNELANSKLAKMHHNVDFGRYRSVIGTYRNADTEITVYVTMFDDTHQAAEMMTAMAENLKAGKSPQFSYVHQLEKSGFTVHLAQSGDSFHYFFRLGKQDIWLTAPADRGPEVLDEFLLKYPTGE